MNVGLLSKGIDSNINLRARSRIQTFKHSGIQTFKGGGSVARSQKEILEFKNALEKRMKDFSVAVFRFLDALPKKNSTRVIAYQLGKSASSIGANYREANRGESKADFAHKIQIALKEAAETCYWLDILADLYPMHATPRNLLAESTELRNLLQTVSRKMRNTKENV